MIDIFGERQLELKRDQLGLGDTLASGIYMSVNAANVGDLKFQQRCWC